MQICNGLDDYFTCTLGTCIRLSDRPDWPIDWWERVDPAQFGGELVARLSCATPLPQVVASAVIEVFTRALQGTEDAIEQETHRFCTTHGSGTATIPRATPWV